MKKPKKPTRRTKVHEFVDVCWRSVGEAIDILNCYDKNLEVEIFENDLYVRGEIELSDEEFDVAMRQYEKDLRAYKIDQLEKKMIELEKPKGE